jgi:hypothetical protein
VKTKAEFLALINAELSSYPVAAQRAQAGDPIVLGMLSAMASVLSNYSAEMDVAAAEPFVKARDVTVLADAAVKGILPYATPTKVTISVENTNTRPLQITAGRGLQDTRGRSYVVTIGATIAAGATGTITAIQKASATTTHTVTESKAFYSFSVPSAESGSYIASIRLLDSDGLEYAYSPEFVNVEENAKVFHIETDADRAMHVVFGAGDLGGVQPSTGDVYTLIVETTEGEITLDTDAIFAFEYSSSLVDKGAKLTLSTVEVTGTAPLPIETLRRIAQYPSIYDQSAVYLGNFEFLVRRNIGSIKFLSVWNEQIEETARGASVDNVNTLFVSALSDSMTQAALNEKIAAIIKTADDSYKIKNVAAVTKNPAVAITAQVSEVYDFAELNQQIAEIVLAEYGEDSDFAQYGRGRIKYKRLYDLLTSKLQALQAENSDLQITITDPDAEILPEHFRYVSEASLTVTVEPFNVA